MKKKRNTQSKFVEIANIIGSGRKQKTLFIRAFLFSRYKNEINIGNEQKIRKQSKKIHTHNATSNTTMKQK